MTARCYRCSEFGRELDLGHAKLNSVQRELRLAEKHIKRLVEENASLAIALAEETTERRRLQKAGR